MTDKSLAGRLALITGASRGIGRAVALAIAKAGAHVILVGRTQGALEDVDDEVREQGGTATLLQLDLRQGDKLDGLGPTIYQRWGKLDILVGNAGILGPLSPMGHITADAWTDVIETNLTANWRLIRTCDPLLRKSDAGRAIFVTSGVGAHTEAYWGPYAVSKAGLDTLVKTYALEMERSTVRANLVSPGAVRTAMRMKAFPGENPDRLTKPDEVAPMFVELASPACTLNGATVSFSDWKAAQSTAAQH